MSRTAEACRPLAVITGACGGMGLACARTFARHHRLVLAGGSDPHAMAMQAYGFSKYGVLRLCEQRAVAWGPRGARIVSISPGLIGTPMGRKEAAENARAADLLEMTPAGGWGQPFDIAN